MRGSGRAADAANGVALDFERFHGWRSGFAPAVALAITVAFFAALGADVASEDWAVPDALYGLMALAAGWIFSEGRLRRKANG